MVIVLCATYSVFTKLSALEDPGTVFYSIQISACTPPFHQNQKSFFYIQTLNIFITRLSNYFLSNTSLGSYDRLLKIQTNDKSKIKPLQYLKIFK